MTGLGSDEKRVKSRAADRHKETQQKKGTEQKGTEQTQAKERGRTSRNSKKRKREGE